MIFYLLISTYISSVFRLIIPSLYSTSSPEIITSEQGFSFSLYSILNCSTTFSTMWFLVALLFIIILNCFACYLTFKFKYLLIVSLRVYSLFTSSLTFYRPDFFLTIGLLLANVQFFFFYIYYGQQFSGHSHYFYPCRHSLVKNLPN